MKWRRQAHIHHKYVAKKTGEQKMVLAQSRSEIKCVENWFLTNVVGMLKIF